MVGINIMAVVVTYYGGGGLFVNHIIILTYIAYNILCNNIITYFYVTSQVTIYVRGDFVAKKLTITKLKGEDGHKVFSIRVKEDTVNKLDEIATATNRSRNELINIMLEFGIENYEITDTSDEK